MFHYEDKINLVADNIVNRNGDITNYKLTFPITEEDLNIPDDIIHVSIIECCEGFDSSYGYESFKICVGKITSFNEIRRNEIKNVIFGKKAISCMEGLDDKLCYFKNDNNIYMVFAKIDEGDIVVETQEELKEALMFISKRFETIQNEILRIKEYNKEKEIIESDEDDKCREKRMKICIKQRKINNGGNYV